MQPICLLVGDSLEPGAGTSGRSGLLGGEGPGVGRGRAWAAAGSAVKSHASSGGQCAEAQAVAVCQPGWTRVYFHSWCSWTRPRRWAGGGGTAEADVLEVIRVPVVTLKQDDDVKGGSRGSEGRVWTRETEAEDSRKVIVGAAGNGDIWGEKGRDGARVWAGHRLTAFLEVAGG